MRVTTNTVFNNISTGLNKHFSALSNQNDHLQYRVLRAGDDTVSQNRILSLQKSISDFEIYSNSAQTLTVKLTEMETSMDSYSELMLELDKIIGQVSNSTTSEQDLDAVISNLDHLSSDIASLMNIKGVDGQYLFSGTKTADTPYEMGTKVIDINGVPTSVDMYIYQGNADTQKVKIGDSTISEGTMDGSSVLEADGANVFEMIAKLKSYLQSDGVLTGVQLDDIASDMDKLNQKTTDVISNLGYSYRQAERIVDNYDSVNSEYLALLSSEQDADYVQVVSQIQKHQQLMTTMSSTSKIIMEMSALSLTS